jgi:hypothetical protein
VTCEVPLTFLRFIIFGEIFLDIIWDLNSGLPNCKAGTLPLEPHLHSISLLLFWRWGLGNYLPGLASNLSPPYLSLPNSYDYQCPTLRLFQV